MNDAHGIAAALGVSTSGRCKRRKIGAAVCDASGRILGIGMNGTPDCMADCHEKPCPAADLPAGQGNAATACYGVHAEVRALLAAGNPRDAHTLYATKAPCTNCTLMMLQTGVRRIVFMTSSNETTNRDLWQGAGREWVHFDGTAREAA